ERRPGLRPSAAAWSLGPAAAGVFALAFAQGAGANALGPERGISIVAPPLLGLMLWNVGVFALLAARAVWRILAPPRRDPSGGRAPRALDLLEKWRGRFLPSGDQPEDRVARRHAAGWAEASAPVASARAAAVFHAAAGLMVAGTLAGMYWRGLIFEYRATWESTFLGAELVDALLGIFLWPARLMLDLDLPAAAEMRSPASGPAAPFIHAWAATAALLVIAPRFLLALRSLGRARRLAARLPLVLPASYVRRLLASASTREHEVLVVPYSFRPTEKAATALRGLLLDLIGARAHVRIAGSVAYGAGAPLSESLEKASWQVLLFNMAQTPEVEVHGEALAGTAERLADGQRLLVVVDEGPLAGKTAADSREERLLSRRRAWKRVVESADGSARAAFLDLGAAESARGGAAIETLAAAVWRREEA
ncbi:MAG: hypothetical protein AAF725_21885, partial [Acidobacteriota bacterium]